MSNSPQESRIQLMNPAIDTGSEQSDETGGERLVDSRDPQQVEFPIEKRYTTWTGNIDTEVGEAALKLEKVLGMPVVLFLQSWGDDELDSIGQRTLDEFLEHAADLPKGRPVALILHSPGGDARTAYKLATFLRRHCGGFIAVVPRYAKSAATLLALGASEIRLGLDAELGPLDVQIFDPEVERPMSGLDECQSIERLHATALASLDRTMRLLGRASGKKVETLLPTACRFVTDFMRPLLEKVDAVHLTQTQRQLLVAQEYAQRLLREKYGYDAAKEMARQLVWNYPDHTFVIDADEAEEIGLETTPVDEQTELALQPIRTALHRETIIGRVKALTPNTP